MKLLLATGAMVGMGGLLSLGIVLAARGNPWLLLGGAVAFGIAFVRLGCLRD